MRSMWMYHDDKGQRRNCLTIVDNHDMRSMRYDITD